MNELHSHWWHEPFKWILVLVCGWMGVEMDVEPARIFLWLWCIDLISYSVKEIVMYSWFPIEKIVKRGLRYISLLLIPFTMILIAKGIGKDYTSLHNMTVFVTSIFMAITTMSNITTMFSRVEYQNDQLIVYALNGIRNKLIKLLKK